jgi:acetate kinase
MPAPIRPCSAAWTPSSSPPGSAKIRPPVRAALCANLAWLGVELDQAANATKGPRISTADSKISVWVIPTDEERMIAEHTRALVQA